jgi:hypothetical protein
MMSIKWEKVWVTGFLLLAGYCSPLYAAAYYSGVAVEYLNVNVDGSKFHPWNAMLKLGSRFSQDLAVEAHYATSIQDDDINGLNLDVKENIGVYGRYQSADSFSGMVVYFLAGYAWTTIETAGTYAIPDQDYESFSWGIGIEDRSQAARRMAYTFQYTSYYNNDGLQVDGFSLGARYDF